MFVVVKTFQSFGCGDEEVIDLLRDSGGKGSDIVFTSRVSHSISGGSGIFAECSALSAGISFDVTLLSVASSMNFGHSW